ncbi:hypothetical protein BBJ28_00016213 [Nothophytophthora sp. Chile5]|nr:hypothetical protein BBJ28_00016213 [Nothophytophthora sp. Chile5]
MAISVGEYAADLTDPVFCCYLQIRPPQKSIWYVVRSGLYLPSKTKASHPTSHAIGIPSRTADPSSSSPESVHYASVEERHRLRDSLRTQLSISDKPVTNSPHPNSMASLSDAQHFVATPADAARLEELMLLEAIRRSMQDIHVAKDNEQRAGSQNSRQDTRGSGDHDDDDESDVDYTDVEPLDSSQISVTASGSVRYSSNRFDALPPARNSDTPPPRSSTPRWNPFDD